MAEDIKLSKDFSLGEFLRSETARKKNIKNEPTQKVIENLKYLCEHCLQPLRDHFETPITINSGYRCPQLNKAIGGSPTSFHSLGCAADIQFNGETKHTLKDIFDFFHKRGIYTELIAEELPDGWIHIAIQKGRETERQLKYKLAGQGVKRGDYDTITKLVKKKGA